MSITGDHVVIWGKAGSGKSTLAKEMQTHDSIIFDLDELAAIMNPEFSRKDNRPWEVAESLIQYRDALVDRARRDDLGSCRLIVIISDRSEALKVARMISGRLLRPER